MSLNLSATTHSLEVTTTGAGTVHVEVSFTDDLAGVRTGGSQVTTITTATTTTVCSAPAASTVRFIDEMTVMAVGANGVTVKKDISATETTLIGSLSLAAGERAQFVSARGWRVFNADGSEKVGTAAGGGGIAASASIFGGSISSGTLQFSNHTLYTGFTGRASLPNVIFSLAGSDLAASAFMGFGDEFGPFGATRMDLINSNNMTFGATITSVAGSGSRVFFTGSYLPQLGVVSHVGGNVVSSATRLAFSNANNVTFSLSTAANGATLLGSVVTSAQQTFIGGIAGGTQTATSGTIVFSNSNNVSFGLSGSTRMTAQAFQNISAGTTNGVLSGLSFVDGAGISFGLNGSSITAQFAQQIGLFSHIGGNSVANVSRLAFSNASNVTWSLSTAAQAATLIASVNAAAAGGIAIAASGSTQSDSTVQFARPTILDGGMASATLGNVAFAFDTGANSTRINATALMRITANLTTSGGFPVSKLEFRDGGGIQWGVATSNDAEGRGVQVTAKLADLNLYLNGSGVGSAFVAQNQTTGSVWLTPFLAMPFPGNMTANTFALLLGGGAFSGTQTGAFSFTVRGGVYTLANSTQLSLANSFSITSSATTQATTERNNRFGLGDRYLTAGTGQWSSSPVFSAGVQYWIGLNVATGGFNILVALQANRFFQAGNTAFGGDFGVSHAAGSSFGAVPFAGYVNTTAIPASIGTAALVANSNSALAPVFEMRNGLFRQA